MSEPGVGRPELDFERDPAILAELVDALDLGVFSVDADGRFVAWSRCAEQLTGLCAGEVVGRPCGGFDRPGGRGLGVAAEVDAGGAIRAIDGRIRGRGGREFDVRGRVRPILDGRGVLVGALGWFRELAGLVVRGADGVAAPRRSADPETAADRLLELVGASPPMQEVFRRIRLAARSDVTTVVVGESGTGKELAARAVHELGPRAGRRFVALNCSALPETLLESELFGHVAGAFTGAVRDHAGLLEAADGGTLFLDEIGDVSPLMQVKLLRALQEREIRRVGGERSIAVDVRLICATHRDLRELVASGAMREDFYYRIRVFEIGMPPLRERREDLPLLVEHLVEQQNARQGRRVRGVSREALRRLLEHRWPGNVRELRNVIEHAFVTVESDLIEPFDLPEELHGATPERPAASARPAAPVELDVREIADRERVLDALNACRWNRTETARLLGVSRVTLWKRMRHYRIDDGSFRRGG